MRLSTKKRDELYAAIHIPILDTRIRLLPDGRYQDIEIAGLEDEIWRRVCKVLELEVPR